MLSQSKHLYSLSRWRACSGLNSYFRHDCWNYVAGVSIVFRNVFCTVTEPIDTTTEESPELPGCVNDKKTNKPEDGDYIPSSVSYWIENHKLSVQDVGMKNIVHGIVERDVDKISKILKIQSRSPDLVIKALDGCDVDLSKALVVQILRRFSQEWVPSYGFFKWAELKIGNKHSPDVYNLMVDGLGKTRKFEIMWELVEEMKCLKGYVTLETMTKIMRRLSKAHKYDEAIEAFELMESFGVKKDIKALNHLMDYLVNGGSVEHAEIAYNEFRENIPPTIQTYNVLVHGWNKIKKIERAEKTVDEMKACGFRPDVVTYTSFIEAYCRVKDFRKVNSTLEEMEIEGIHTTVVMYTIMMNAYLKNKKINKAIAVYEKMKRNKCSPDAVFYNIFIGALNRAGRLKDSDEVFEDMARQGVSPDVSTYNTMIIIAANNMEEEKALNLLMEMERKNNCKPNIDTYAPLLKLCCRLKRMKVLSFLLGHMFENDVSLDPGTYSLLVSELCKNGSIVRACEFFDEMVDKGLGLIDFTYDILMKELEKKGMTEEKVRVEEAMARAKLL